MLQPAGGKFADTSPPPQWTADEASICKCEYKEDLDKMLSKSFPQCRSTAKTAQLQFAIFKILFAQRTRLNVYLFTVNDLKQANS